MSHVVDKKATISSSLNANPVNEKLKLALVACRTKDTICNRGAFNERQGKGLFYRPQHQSMVFFDHIFSL